jgi:hypothetical protein
MTDYLLTTQASVNANLLTDSGGAQVPVVGQAVPTVTGFAFKVPSAGNWQLITTNGGVLNVYALAGVPGIPAGTLLLACSEAFRGSIESLADGVINVIPVAAPAP